MNRYSAPVSALVAAHSPLSLLSEYGVGAVYRDPDQSAKEREVMSQFTQGL